MINKYQESDIMDRFTQYLIGLVDFLSLPFYNRSLSGKFTSIVDSIKFASSGPSCGSTSFSRLCTYSYFAQGCQKKAPKYTRKDRKVVRVFTRILQNIIGLTSLYFCS